MNNNEARARVLIDSQLATLGWDTKDTNAVRYEVALPDGTRADYALCDRHGRTMAVIEAKHFSINRGEQDVKSLRIPLPTLARQREFAARAEEVRAIQSQQSTAKAQAAFDALLARVFSPGARQ